jgi:hypothetical protein
LGDVQWGHLMTHDSLGCLNGNWKLFVFTIERSVFLCSFVVVSGRDFQQFIKLVDFKHHEAMT